jgi:hypothetical protein
MNLKQSIRRLFFKSIDAELLCHEKQIDSVFKNLKLCDKEQALHSKILMTYMETFQSLKRDEGLTTPFNEKIVVKFNV